MQTIHYRVEDIALSTDGDLVDGGPNSGVHRLDHPDRSSELTDD